MSKSKILNFKIFSRLFLALSAVGIILSFIYKNYALFKWQIVIGLVFLYITTSLIYHYFDKSLTFIVAIEYILIAVLSLIVLSGILF